jgi:hypothetical protein
MKLDIDITLDKWGLFEPFDGEIFNNPEYTFNEKRNEEYDYYIQTIKISKTEYYIFYVPTKRTLERDPESKVIKVYVTENLIKQHLKKNNKFGIWNIRLDEEVIEIDNFVWYYLGLGETAGLKKEVKLNRSKKYSEIMKNIEKYSQENVCNNDYIQLYLINES